jgi:hypothetical protein
LRRNTRDSGADHIAGSSIGSFGLGEPPALVEFEDSKISIKFALDQMQ